ncbi:MAG: DUF3987 domain-containing protein [Gammaproteobacteria bacterium]|nr:MULTISPECIES: DUF3987 domain-containing protein [Pseudomonadota]NOX77669.1 DUF3987 domain-containing protein [Gammaproteobacteria bacterium]NPA79053.1 DUF3987 domain-containing protein [Gammaproteobacteria bacterium]ONG39026.1 hypothetical protein BKE17_06375 [Enhydrobacter sp. H5]VXB23436.1 conserved hypothetical protein [Enhydrobacter sp. AX1]
MSNLAISKNTNKAFHEFIKGQPTASYETYQHNPALVNLAHCIGKDKLLFIDSNYTVDNANQPTANSIGVMLFDEHYQPSNLAIFPLNNAEPFPLHGLENDCFILGNGGQVVAVASLDTAIELYPYLTINGEYSLIAPFKDWQFERMVKAHASHSQVTLFTDYPTGKQLETTFKGYNVRLVATVDTITDLVTNYLLDEIINDPNKEPALQTKVKELNGIEWGEPEPLEDTNPTPTRYPIEAWQGVLRQAVEAIAYHAQVPLAMAGQCILGALSTIGQRYINAPMGHEHKPACLYLITEGESGSGKTQANKYSHYSITKWEKNAYQLFVERLQEWEADRNALKGGERTHYEATVPKPTNESMIVTDATIEAVLDKFIIDGLPNQSWTTSEAGQFLNGHSMKSDTAGNALSSLTSVWSGDPVSRLRSQRGKNAIPFTNAYDARLTLDIMGQRVILEPALNDPLMNGQGFLPRCLIACPESLIGSRQWATPERMNQSPYDDPRLLAYWARCDILLDPPQTEITRDITGKEVRFNMPFADQQARQTLANFQDEIEGRQAKGRALEYLRAFASRMAENASRIASLMAFFDCQKSVSVDYLERAFMLVEYSIAERLRYLDAKPTEKTDSQKLIDWIVKQCKVKGVTQLSYADTQSKVNPKHLRAKANFELCINVLSDKKYIQVITLDNTRYIEVNPSLLS